VEESFDGVGSGKLMPVPNPMVGFGAGTHPLINPTTTTVANIFFILFPLLLI
jgi:hypothetical protein